MTIHHPPALAALRGPWLALSPLAAEAAAIRSPFWQAGGAK